MITEFLQDGRFALRQMRRAPFFTVTVLLTLTVAIGATAAMTGVLRATLLNRLPYPEPDRLLQIGDHNLRGFKTSGLIAVARTADLEAMEHDGHRVLASLGYYFSDTAPLSVGGHEADVVTAPGVSGDFFRTVGVAPLLGRAIVSADDAGHGPTVAVLSYRLWQSKFGGDPRVVGRVVQLKAEQATIVGVMPERFDLPLGSDLWRQGHILPANFGGYRGDGSRFVIAFGRVAAEETAASARQAAAVLAAQLARAHPETDAAWDFELTDLRGTLFGEYRHALELLAAAVGLVLLVAAVNLASLQLSRNAAREGEFAIRSALGVSHGRLTRQVITEAMLLVVAGGAMGVALGASVLRVLAARLPEALLSVERPHVDGAVLLAACAVVLLVGVCTSIVPAMQATRAGLRLSANRNLGRHTRSLGRGFTVVQIGLALDDGVWAQAAWTLPAA